MKKIFTLILAVVASFVMSSSMKADGSHTINMKTEPGDWASVTEWFDMSTIASELGLEDVESLTTAISSWTNNSYASNFFSLKISDDEWSYEHGNAADGAYYITKDGAFMEGWGSAAAYVRLDTDNDAGQIGITIGQTPSCGENTINVTVAICLNTQKVIFNTTCVVATPTADIEPVTTIANLNVIGQYTVKAQQEPNSDWEPESYSLPLPGICEALGIEASKMEENLSPMLFAKQYDYETYNWSTELAKDFTATPSPGFWFSHGVILGEGEDETESSELTWDSYGGNNKFWISSIAFDGASETLTFEIGQYPEAWSNMEEHSADLYIVYGDKACVVTLDVTVGIDPSKTIEGYNKVGETEISFKRDVRKGWEDDTLAVDMNTILAAFPGVTSADSLIFTAEESTGLLTTDYTADTLGFWFDADDGAVIDYQAGYKSYVIYLATDSTTGAKSLMLCNMPDAFDGGESCSSNIYFINGKNYYAVKVSFTTDAPAYTFDQCEMIEQDITIEQNPSSNWQTGTTDASFIGDVIGTQNGKFYGVKSDGTITDSYTVSEASSYGGGGFWMGPVDESGVSYAANYSAGGNYAIWYYESEFNWFNRPGVTAVGDEMKSTFYIANLWEGKVLKLNLTLKFVKAKVIITTVGSEDAIADSRNAEGEDYAEQTIDLSKCAEALGAESQEALLEAGTWEALDADDNFVEASTETFNDMYGFTFNADGKVVDADAEDAEFQVGIIDGAIHSYVIDNANTNNVYNTTLYMSYNSKLYAINITVCGDANAIKNVETVSAKNGKVYDLAGRAIAKPAKGMYIQNGKKYLVK